MRFCSIYVASAAIVPPAWFYPESDMSQCPDFFMISADLFMQDFPIILSAQVNKLLWYRKRNDKVLYFPW